MDVLRVSELQEASPLDNAALLPVVLNGGKRTNVGALRDRTFHTGSQPIASVTGLQTALDGKSAAGHGHQIGDCQGLQAALDAKAASSHSHDAAALTSGTVDIARLPVAASGVSSSTQLVRADDSRLAGGSGGTGLPWASIPAGTTVSIDTGRQMMVFCNLTIDGSLVVDGSVGIWS
ncbi:MAG: hypothetical protein WCF85_21175 [Rhodospirillaceae bacterium]